MPLKQQLPRVAIFLSGSHTTHREILRGILRFTHVESPWAISIEMGREADPDFAALTRLAPTGVITNRIYPALQRYLNGTDTPVVRIERWKANVKSIVANVSCDSRTVGQLAAEHLLGCGFTHFAYVGEPNGVDWSLERGRAFVATLRSHRREVQSCPPLDRTVADAANRRQLRAFLCGLPKPVAVFAATDLRAREVLDICLSEGIAVPDEAAILGVDDDEVICETAHPTLSSIPMSTEEAGYAAAQTLDRAMAGTAIRRQPRKIVYTGKEIVSRESTGRNLTSDALVARCRELMHANINSPLRVSDLAKALACSRRTLETRFRVATGRSPNDELTSIKVLRARRLLEHTSMTLDEIAEACHFCDASYLVRVFLRTLGRAPSDFRPTFK